jgi:hypothetical protein
VPVIGLEDRGCFNILPADSVSGEGLAAQYRVPAGFADLLGRSVDLRAIPRLFNWVHAREMLPG